MENSMPNGANARRIMADTVVNKEEVIPELDDERRRESEEARRKFKIRYNKALTTIVLSVSPSLLYLLGDPEYPVKVWDTLENQFQKKSWANKLILKSKLSRMRLKENQSVSEHIKSMTEIFQELSIIGQPMEEEDRVVQLLTSLPKKFNVLVTSLLSNVEVPSMEMVTERIMHEDRKLKEVKEIETREIKNQALYASRTESRVRREPPTCFYCGFKGHIKRNCDTFRKDQEKLEKQNMKRNQNRNNKLKENNANFSASKLQEEDEESSDSESGFCALGNHVLASVTVEERKKWLVDSGASKHMANDEKQFDKLEELEKPEKIKVGDGFYLTATMQGEIKLKLKVNGKIKTCTLRNVLYVPELSYNLLSVSKATESGKQVSFDDQGCEIKSKRTEEVLLQAVKRNSLYYANTIEEETTEVANCAEASEKVSKERLWHSRYGHLGDQSLLKLVKDDMVDGLDYKNSLNKDETVFCEPCAEGKQQQIPTWRKYSSK